MAGQFPQPPSGATLCEVDAEGAIDRYEAQWQLDPAYANITSSYFARQGSPGAMSLDMYLEYNPQYVSQVIF